MTLEKKIMCPTARGEKKTENALLGFSVADTQKDFVRLSLGRSSVYDRVKFTDADVLHRLN